MDSIALRYATLMFVRGSTIVIKFGLNLYVAKFVGLDALGIYGLIVAISLTAPVFIRAGLVNTISRSLIDADPEEMTHHIKHYLLWILFAYGLILALIAPTLHFTDYPVSFAVALVILVIVAGEHIASDIHLLLNNLHRTQTANFFGLVQSILCVVPFVVLSWYDPSLRNIDVLLASWAIGTSLSVFGACFLFSNWPWCASPPFSLAWYRNHLHASGYLFAADVIGALSQFVDRYMIAFFISIEQAGVYTLFYQLANSVYTLVTSSILNFRRPKIISAFNGSRVVEAYAQIRSLRKESVLAFVGLSISVGGAFLIIAPWIGRPAVLNFMPLLGCIFLATGLKTLCHADFIEPYARHYDRELFWLSMLTFVAIALGGFLAIPSLGIYGIPASIGLTYLATILLVGPVTKYKKMLEKKI